MKNFEWFKNENENEKAKEEAEKILKTPDIGQDDSLKKDYEIRGIIGKTEDIENTEKLAEMNKEGILFQDKQKEFFDNLKDQLYNIASIIQQKEDLLNQFQLNESKLKELNKKNFKLHNSFSLEDDTSQPSDLDKQQSSDLEKQINFLKSQVDFLSKKIKEENVTEENISLIRKEYEKLNKQYETLSKAWFPVDPSLN